MPWPNGGLVYYSKKYRQNEFEQDVIKYKQSPWYRIQLYEEEPFYVYLYHNSNNIKSNKILNDADRPVQLIFAGKAHPKDIEGQNLIKRIHEISLMPQFKGKIFVLENYNIGLNLMEVSNNKIITYNIEDIKNNTAIFGEEFVENNKNICNKNTVMILLQKRHCVFISRQEFL